MEGPPEFYTRPRGLWVAKAAQGTLGDWCVTGVVGEGKSGVGDHRAYPLRHAWGGVYGLSQWIHLEMELQREIIMGGHPELLYRIPGTLGGESCLGDSRRLGITK